MALLFTDKKSPVNRIKRGDYTSRAEMQELFKELHKDPNLKIGDIFIQYTDDEPYQKFLKMAQDALNSQIATSVKTTTYNADASKGSVDWKKNIDGSSNTLNVRQSPRNIG